MTANSQVWLVLILAGLSERQEKEGGGGGEGGGEVEQLRLSFNFVSC